MQKTVQRSDNSSNNLPTEQLFYFLNRIIINKANDKNVKQTLQLLIGGSLLMKQRDQTPRDRQAYKNQRRNKKRFQVFFRETSQIPVIVLVFYIAAAINPIKRNKNGIFNIINNRNKLMANTKRENCQIREITMTIHNDNKL